MFFAQAFRDLLKGIGTVLIVVATILYAVGLWVFYLLPRARWVIWNWICRFSFFAKHLHFQPLPEPPPKKTLDERLSRLDFRVFGSGGEVRALRTAPASTATEAGEVAGSEPPAAAVS